MESDATGSGTFMRSACSLSRLAEDHNNGYENRMKELAEANIKWQKYDAEREAYVKRLQGEAASKDSKISGLQAQLGAANEKFRTSEESRRQVERDNALLLGQLQSSRKEIQELTNSSELLALREEQVKAYKEDFESERRDRERTQSRLADVELELEIVKRELRQYNLREMQDLHQRRQAALDYHRQEYLKKNPQSVYQNDHFDDRNPEDGEDEVDG